MEPLQGIRIVELTTNVAAPMGTQLLADQGADVIRIEAPGAGDPARAVGAVRNGVTSYYLALNRNKRALAMDLKDERSRPLMADLLQSADVFVHNTRPGAVERLGYGYEAVHAINPGLIYVALSGFGPDGPGAGNRVYDLVVQAVSGMARVQAGARRFTTADLVARMEAAEVPCAKVNDFAEVIADPRVVHRGSLVEYDHPQGGRVRQPRPAAIFGHEPCAIRRPAPALGEHTDEVFTALGHTPEHLAELRRAGVLG